MIASVLLSCVAAGAQAPASTWVTAGVEHEHFAAFDTNRDGFEDIVVAARDGSLLVAESVRGWKARPWQALDGALWASTFERATGDTTAVERTPSPPPYEPDARLLRTFGGDLDGDGDRDAIAVYRCTRPHDFLELRVAFTPGPHTDDRDGDGLTEADEARLATDPLDRDSDHDGLLDGWEVHGLPRGIDAGAKTVLSPARQDVLVAIAPYEGVDRAKLEGELERAAQLYRALATTNLDGSSGIQVHFRIDASVAPADQAGGDWAACGAKLFASRERGVMHWMQVTPWGGGQSQQTGDMGGAGQGFAVFAHEFGHQLSLSHEGDSAPAWCPLYPSLMNYAFGYSLGGDAGAIRFSSGEFRATVLDERALSERLPYAIERLRYLAVAPFRYTLAADGDAATRIDWNHDGRFDDALVAADINYGSSTHCGIRRDLGFAIGAAPALCYVGEHCYLVTVDPAESAVSVREYAGAEKWGEPRLLANAATSEDPLVVGTDSVGCVFLRRPTGWLVWRFDAAETREQAEVAGLPDLDLGGACVGERVLLITRASNDALAAHWLPSLDRLEVTPAQPLTLTSQVPVGVAVDPADGRVVVASAATNSRSVAMCLRLTWFRVEGERLVEAETRWVRGEASGTNCSTRPVIAFDSAGQLNVFHTGLPQGDGSMTAWRTRRVGNAALDEGWLTCLLYDVWTRTRRAIAFASGPQGALYAFRWDAAEAHGMRLNQLLVAHNGFGLDPEPMQDFDDGAKMSLHGLVHSILWMQAE